MRFVCNASESGRSRGAPTSPPAVVASLLSAATAAHADPDVKAKLEAQGFDVSGQSGPEFAADIKVQAQRWARLVKASGFKAQSKE